MGIRAKNRGCSSLNFGYGLEASCIPEIPVSRDIATSFTDLSSASAARGWSGGDFASFRVEGCLSGDEQEVREEQS